MRDVTAADRRAADSRIVQRRWRERIDAWLRSDKDERVFCEREKIGVCALRWWMKRLRARKGAKVGGAGETRSSGPRTALELVKSGAAVPATGGLAPTDTDAARKWARLSSEWEQSGVRQTEFCRRRGLAVHTLRWWRWRLGGADRRERQSPAPTTSASASVPATRPAFVPIEVVDEPSLRGAPRLPTVDVLLRRQRRVRVGADFDPALLARVVTVLEATP